MNEGDLWLEKRDFVAKEALFAMRRSLLCMTIMVHLCVKQGLFASQGSLVCGSETAFLRQNITFLFAQKCFRGSNDMAVSSLRLHAVFCEIPVGFPFLRE